MNHDFGGGGGGGDHGGRATLRHATTFADHHHQHRPRQADHLRLSVHSNVSIEDLRHSLHSTNLSVHSNLSIEDITDRSLHDHLHRALLSNKAPPASSFSILSKASAGHSFVSTVKLDHVQSAVPMFSAHKNAPLKANKQSVKLSRDLMELLSSKKVLVDPLAVEPGSDISASDVASLSDLDAFAAVHDGELANAPKPEEPKEDFMRGISDTLEDLDDCKDDDETTSMNVSLPGMMMMVSRTPSDMRAQLSMAEAHDSGRVVEAFGPSLTKARPGRGSINNNNASKELDSSIETFGSNNHDDDDDDSSEPCASFAEESSGEYAPIRMSDRSYRSAFSSRRNSFASTGSALESISEVAVFEEDYDNVPGSSEFMVGSASSINTSDLEILKNIVSLDQVNHRSSFTIGSSNGSNENENDSSTDDQNQLNETLLDIIQQDGTSQNDISDDNIDDDDLEFYAQLFAESLDQEPSGIDAVVKLRKPSTIGRCSSYESARSYGSALSTSKLHRDSFVARPAIVSRDYSYGSTRSYGSAVSTSKLHRDSFVARPAVVGRDTSLESTQSFGSAVSTSKLHRDSFVVHTEALEGSPEMEDLSVRKSGEEADFHETLMGIMDDGRIEEHLDDVDNDGEDQLDDHDLDLYAQALADNLAAENEVRADSGHPVGPRRAGGHPLRMKSSMSSMGSVASGLQKDSLHIKHMMQMDGDHGGDDMSIDAPENNRPFRRFSSGNMSIRSGMSGMTDFGLSDGKKNSPNRPHPALEYPMFYSLLRQCPWLFERVKVAYAYRWKLSYPLQRRPFNGYLERYRIFLNWGEMLLLLPFFVAAIAGVMYSFVFPSVAVSGRVARYGLIGALLLAQRNSMLTFIIGLPFDRAIFYHKLAGRLAGAAGITHTIAFFLDPEFQEVHRTDALGGAFSGSVNISGTMIMILMVGIIISSLQRIRRQMFEVFYYLHYAFIVGMVISAYFHSGILVPILTALTWGVDLFIRSIVMARVRYPRRATLEIISETVVQLSFPKTSNFAYNPGQYAYICVPEISWLEWHPFSISSSPKQMSVTFHIRKAGSFTSALYKLAQKRQEVSVLLEGPYGNLAVDILSDRKYKRIMLISGGIGLTPMQSICDQLLYERAKNRRELNSLQFIWIERDPVLMQEHEFIRRTSSIGSLGSLDLDDLSLDGSIKLDEEDDQAVPHGVNVFLGDSGAVNGQLGQLAHREHSTNIASQLLSLLPPDRTTDAELEQMYASHNLLDLNDNNDGAGSRTIPHAVDNGAADRTNNNNLSNKEDETSFADNSASWGMESSRQLQTDLANVLNMKVYLTGNNRESPNGGNGGGNMMIPFAEQGRPDFPKLFETEIKNSKRGEKIAVLVSAPPKLMEVVEKACIRHSRNKRNVRFDYHSEYLGM